MDSGQVRLKQKVWTKLIVCREKTPLLIEGEVTKPNIQNRKIFMVWTFVQEKPEKLDITFMDILGRITPDSCQ